MQSSLLWQDTKVLFALHFDRCLQWRLHRLLKLQERCVATRTKPPVGQRWDDKRSAFWANWRHVWPISTSKMAIRLWECMFEATTKHERMPAMHEHFSSFSAKMSISPTVSFSRHPHRLWMCGRRSKALFIIFYIKFLDACSGSIGQDCTIPFENGALLFEKTIYSFSTHFLFFKHVQNESLRRTGVCWPTSTCSWLCNLPHMFNIEKLRILIWAYRWVQRFPLEAEGTQICNVSRLNLDPHPCQCSTRHTYDA